MEDEEAGFFVSEEDEESAAADDDDGPVTESSSDAMLALAEVVDSSELSTSGSQSRSEHSAFGFRGKMASTGTSFSVFMLDNELILILLMVFGSEEGRNEVCLFVV